MDRVKAVCVGIIAADAVINIICFIAGRKAARTDQALTEALFANRDAVLKRNEVLEQEVKGLERLLSLAMSSQKKEKEEEVEKIGN